MFSSLTSYLFGSAEEPTEEPTATEATPNGPEDKPSNPELRTRAAENEWILVEKSRPRPRPRSTSRGSRHADPGLECSLGPLFKSSDLTNTVLGSSHHHQQPDILDSSLCMSQGLGYHSDNDVVSDDATESDMSSVPEPIVYPSMEESWLVTPPACFTAGSSRMETSSLENLLIEHPSMSVYSHRGRQSSAGDESDASSVQDDVPPSHPAGRSSRQAGLARREPQHRPNPLSARVGLTQAKNVKSMQRSQQRRVNKELSLKRVLRSNAVRQAHIQSHRGSKPPRALNQPRAHTTNKH